MTHKTVTLADVKPRMILARNDIEFPAGAVEVNWDDPSRGAALGGGFVFKLETLFKECDFHIATEEEMRPKWRESGFSIEDTEGFPIRGWTADKRWNGWAMPMFEFKEAMQITKLLGLKDVLGYEDFISHSDPEYIEENEGVELWEAEDIMTPRGVVRVYPVGTGSWIWSEEDDEERVKRLLRDIKELWDKHGLGDSDAESEPVYNRLLEEVRNG